MSTTRAPASSASRWLPSVLPLSATTTSPLMPLSAMNFTALRTQVATVSASLRHGITTVSSTWTPRYVRRFLPVTHTWASSRIGLPTTLYSGRTAWRAPARHKEDTGLKVLPEGVQRALAGNKLFVILMIPAALLRIDAELGYRWQSWFNDSWNYVDTAITLNLDPTRPSGYSFYLWVLKPFHSFALVTVSQHIMGLLVAVMMYALARHRFSTPKWLAAVMTLPVLYDGFEFQLEHLIVSDTLFLFLAMLAILVLLWSPLPPLRAAGDAGGARVPWWRSSWARCALAGLLLGLSAIVRTTGLPLILVFVVYLLLCFGMSRAGWRTLVSGVVAFVVLAVAPVAGYAGWYDLQHGAFNTSESTGVFLYSRVMTFADCSKMQLPPDLLSLCTAVPPDQRPTAQAYIWTDASPLHRFPRSVFSPLPNSLGQQFAIKAIEAQPVSYARVVFDDTWRSFGWSRTAFPNAQTYDEYLFGNQSVPISNLHRVTGYSSSAAAYLAGGNPLTAVVNPFAVIIRDYQRYVWLPGTVYGLILLASLGGIAWRRGRTGLDALLPWASSLVLIVVPAATAEFDYRYVTTAVPFATLALAIAFGRRTEAKKASAVSGASGVPGGAANLPRRIPGGGSGNGSVEPGHDERDFAPDAP